MICYVASQILGLIGLYPFANVLNLAMMFTFLLLMTWSYCKYTGNLSEIGASIDSIAETGEFTFKSEGHGNFTLFWNAISDPSVFCFFIDLLLKLYGKQ